MRFAVAATILPLGITTLLAASLTVAYAADGPPRTEGEPQNHSTNAPAKTDAKGNGDTSSSSSNASPQTSTTGNTDSSEGQTDCDRSWGAILRAIPYNKIFHAAANRLNLQVGKFSPAATNTSTNDTNWLAVELSYSLASPNARKTRFIPSVYIEDNYTNGQTVARDDQFNTTSGRMFYGVGLAERARVPLFHGAAAASFGVGGGLYRLETFHETTSNYNTTDDDDSDCGCSVSDYHTDRAALRHGYRLFAGLNHKNGAYIEAGWVDVGRLDGLPFRGSTISIGFRR